MDYGKAASKLPQDFLTRMEAMLGEEFADFLRTYGEPRRFGLRVNTLKIGAEEFKELAPFHLRQVPWTEDGFYYEREDDPARHPFYYAGLYYLQEPSAMAPAAVLPVVPGERVLDLCAAPGGKATAIAAKLQGRGLLVANEISASRAKALLKNLEVFGVVNSFVTNAPPHRLAEQFPEAFDKILVDAPCSGEGMFRKDPANARAWSTDKVEECAKIQREITQDAVRMLRPGGLLLYSTCTFSPEENEGTVAYLLRKCPEMELIGLPALRGCAPGRAEYLNLLAQGGASGGTFCALREAGILSADGRIYGSWETGPEPVAEEEIGMLLASLGKCARIFPHRSEGEGHFLALLRKKNLPDHAAIAHADDRASSGLRADVRRAQISGSDRMSGGKGNRAALKQRAADPRQDKEPLHEFWKDVRNGWDPERIEVRGDQAYYVPEPPPAGCRLPFLRSGLYLGELRRGRFEPAQAFAMALRPEEYGSVIDFAQDDDRVRRYLRGETVQLDDTDAWPQRPQGWQLVCVEGRPLGWGKLVNGVLKNKYHPGWRMPG